MESKNDEGCDEDELCRHVDDEMEGYVDELMRKMMCAKHSYMWRGRRNGLSYHVGENNKNNEQ